MIDIEEKRCVNREITAVNNLSAEKLKLIIDF